MKPNHVLVVFHTSFPRMQGGINVMIASLVQQWSACGVRASLFAPGDWDQRGLTEEHFGEITLFKRRLRLFKDAKRPVRGVLGWLLELPATLWTLHRLMRREGVDLIHFHTPRDYQLHFLLLSWLGGPPFVVTFHGTDALEFAQGPKKARFVMRQIVQRAAAVTAVSRHYAALLESAYPNLAPIHTIANGISSKECLEDAGVVLPDLPGKYWVMVGWVEPPKAQDVAVMAWGRVIAQQPDLHLLIIGDQPFLRPGVPYYPGFYDQVRQMTEENGSAHRVHFLGTKTRPEVMAILRHAQGLIFPSHREGMPYVLLEAGVVGVPVVCNRIPPFTDILIHGESGLLTPDSDHEALADAVVYLAGHPKQARSMGNALQEVVRRDYSLEGMANGYLALFRSLTGKPFARTPLP
ncbi:MAG: glycosyltransferase family 4 protein [Magnetococcales bacterium]|nr:glycosyltransferase family 4 protein [Magnetococcales bacterium]MBF0438936.1 glycosyltransferase family 4 protein [Magnetococcales bacterium]